MPCPMKKESFCLLSESGITVGRVSVWEDVEEEEEEEEEEEDGQWAGFPMPPLLVISLELDGYSLSNPLPLRWREF